MPSHRPSSRPLRLGLILMLLLALPGMPAAMPALAGALDIPPGVIGKIDPHVLAQTAGGGQAEFLVVLADQANLGGAAGLAPKIEKGRYVYHALLAKAQATQGPLIAWLEARHAEYQAFYIVNMVWVKGGASLVQALAARADVAGIQANPLVKGVESVPLLAPALSAAPAPAGIEPNISYVHAPLLWLLGFTGQGMVIGSGDTGVEWDHPALKPHYRGWNGSIADHNFNWHDSIHTGGGGLGCVADSPAPCDDFGHGTHTTGTSVGDDGGANQIGMAPGAKWIGCRNMDRGNGTPARYIECFQFFLAPYPITGTVADGNPDLAADVTTNSWTCPTTEGCTTPDVLRAAIQAQQAAGIVTVVAAGNDGFSGCSSIAQPPSFYGEAYSVGALNTGSDSIASFSGRGPVTIDGSNRRKPDITAPGTSVRSSLPISMYGNLSGTSMATPHVAGAVALLWSAVPALRGQVTVTEQMLNDSAVHLASTECGSSGSPNNTFGYGRLDVKAAYDLVKTMNGVVSGTVVSAADFAPISGATIQLSRGVPLYTTTTAGSGMFSLSAFTGTYALAVSAFGFLPAKIPHVIVETDITLTLPITLTPALLYYLPVIAR